MYRLWIGRYSFDARAARLLHALRPLRDNREIDGEQDEPDGRQRS